MPYSKKTPFTLIEIMIVVVIIAALASMVVPRLGGRSNEARQTIAKADIKSNIGMALKLYELDNGSYPTTQQGLDALLSKSSSPPVPSNYKGPYLENDPIDPWQQKYMYRFPGTQNPSSFDLYSIGPDGQEGTGDDVTNWK